MAVETLSNITQDEIEYARMTTLIKSEMDWQSMETEAEHRGQNKANLENARKMKADNMPVSQISKYTGLSMETIAQL